MFFVLSGYLICGNLLREHASSGRLQLRRFYARRARRLVPALVAVVVVLTLWDTQPAWTPTGWRSTAFPSTLWHAGLVLTYLTDFVRAAGGTVGSLDHTWSLAVEEQFYVLLPLLLILTRARRQVVVPVLAAAAAAIAVNRTSCVHVGALDHAQFGFDTRADAILAGCIVAYMAGWAGWRRPGAAVAGVLLLAGVTMTTSISWSVGPLVAAAGGVVLVGRYGSGVRSAVLEHPVLVWLGQRSYALYLWHIPINSQVQNHFTVPGFPLPARMALTLTASLAVTAVSWRYVEQPFMRAHQRGQSSRGLVEERVEEQVGAGR